MGASQTFLPQARDRGQSGALSGPAWGPTLAAHAHSAGDLPWWPCGVGHLSSRREPLLV